MPQDSTSLPAPDTTGGLPLAQALLQRRSMRSFSAGSLSLTQVAQLLWAAQGITSRDGLRSAPSAGALYPLEIDLAVGAVEGLHDGVHHYASLPHRLMWTHKEDVRAALAAAAFKQSWVWDAAVVLVISAVFARTTAKYGRRGERYVHMEAGHAAENVLLQATALGLRSVIVGAFDDDAVHQVLQLPADCMPLCLLPIGH